MASQHSLDSVKGDVATVKRTLGRVSSPAILVGHSYGGTVITAAGTDDRVAGLVYIAALAPDADETSQRQQEKSRTCNASWRSVWAPLRRRSPVATSPCSQLLNSIRRL